MREETLRCGKLPHHLLEELLKSLTWEDERIIIGPRVGEDAAVVKWEGKLLVLSSDPITFTSDLLGWYVVMVNANDIASMGAKPRYLLLTLLLPPGSTFSLVASILEQAKTACDELGVSIIGGHTEITEDLPRPIAIGMMVGEAEKVVIPSAKEGDLLFLTKGIAIEGTSILAREFSSLLMEKGIAPEVMEKAKNYIFHPGISVVKEALLVSDYATAMHDPTEGGLANALFELCRVCDVGSLIYESAIPILPECALICEAFNINPLGLISSGALLFTLPKGKEEKILEELRREGVNCALIGEIKTKDFGIKILRKSGKCEEMPYFPRDEVARIGEELGKWEG